jgi:hypothetical protein
MQMRELFAFLARAAAGDTSTCPAAVDVLWHRWLQFPRAYMALCQRHLGVLILHVPDSPSKCHGRVTAP